MKITVIGDGGWGTALAQLLANNGHEITIWGAFPDYIAEMKKSRENSRFLPGITLHPAIKLESDETKAVTGADIVLLATPTQFLRPVLERFKGLIDKKSQILLNVAKGIESSTHKCINEICDEIVGSDITFVTLSGPSHAEEVSRGVPTAVVVASKDTAAACKVRDALMSDCFRVYTSEDVIGVELGGALKNVMAIAAGVCDGMQLGDNPKAALITRGIAEMARLGEAMGGNIATFSGLSGIGDLIVTCTSGHSRNRHVGEELGRGKKLEEIQKAMGMSVAEGVATAKAAFELAQKAGVEVPIIEQTYKVLYKDKSPQTAIIKLMNRSAKAE